MTHLVTICKCILIKYREAPQHNNTCIASSCQMMNKNLQGGIAAGLMNRMPGAPLGAMYNPRFNVPRPNVMRQGSRGPSGVDMMRRMNPVASSTSKPTPRPPQPRYGPGSSANTPIEI